MTENKVTGKAYRILTDKANEIYDRVSFWTHATDVEMENGKNLQEELSSTIDTINGTMTNKISALERTLNSTITNRLSPLETQVNTNKNGIATLNTNLGNLSNTVNSNYTTLNNGLTKLNNKWSWSLITETQLSLDLSGYYASKEFNLQTSQELLVFVAGTLIYCPYSPSQPTIGNYERSWVDTYSIRPDGFLRYGCINIGRVYRYSNTCRVQSTACIIGEPDYSDISKPSALTYCCIYGR